MYRFLSPRRGRACRVIACLGVLTSMWPQQAVFAAEGVPGTAVIRNVTQSTERVEMTVNTSQTLTLDARIPRMVVNNPELVTVTALSESQILLAARKPGVTQINLWDENDKVYTIDLVIFGDVRELDMQLKRSFPGSTIRLVRLTNSLVLEGQVDRPEIIPTIRDMAQDYAPKVINSITVGGEQQVVLRVRVMEVSRTKLRRMAADFAIFGPNGFAASSVSGIISSVSGTTQSVGNGANTVSFGVLNGNTKFFGFLDALEQNNVSKVLAEPQITVISGRPATFNAGGELPILVPSGLGQTTIQYKPFGTQVDVLPIVLGDGNIRLEVRPRISEIDDTRSVTVNNFTVPALKVRTVDTAVEMKAGQTLALAGLLQERVESVKRTVPGLGDIPVIGFPFRKSQEQVNEIELLILVTPDYAGALNPEEVPPCGPGMETVSPSHQDMYCKGYIEVPSCGPCAPGANGCATGRCLPPAIGYNTPGGVPVMATDQGGYGYPAGATVMPTPAAMSGPAMESEPIIAPTPVEEQSMPDPSARNDRQNRHDSSHRAASATRLRRPTATPGLIGPVGYDVQK